MELARFHGDLRAASESSDQRFAPVWLTSPTVGWAEVGAFGDPSGRQSVPERRDGAGIRTSGPISEREGILGTDYPATIE